MALQESLFAEPANLQIDGRTRHNTNPFFQAIKEGRKIIICIDELAGTPPVKSAFDYISTPAPRKSAHKKKEREPFVIQAQSADQILELRKQILEKGGNQAYALTYLRYGHNLMNLRRCILAREEEIQDFYNSLSKLEGGDTLAHTEKTALGFPRIIQITKTEDAKILKLKDKWEKYSGLKIGEDGYCIATKDTRLAQALSNAATGQQFNILAIPVLYRKQGKILWSVESADTTNANHPDLHAT